jgi:hypothetical protein
MMVNQTRAAFGRPPTEILQFGHSDQGGLRPPAKDQSICGCFADEGPHYKEMKRRRSRMER